MSEIFSSWMLNNTHSINDLNVYFSRVLLWFKTRLHIKNIENVVIQPVGTGRMAETAQTTVA